MNVLKKILRELSYYFSDEEDPNEPVYDPVHIGAVIVLSLLGISVLFWLLWSLIVFGGGIQAKILPFLQIVFTSKTKEDFGYIGYPFEMGVFEGWVTNLVALVFSILIVTAIWYIFENLKKDERKI